VKRTATAEAAAKARARAVAAAAAARAVVGGVVDQRVALAGAEREEHAVCPKARPFGSCCRVRSVAGLRQE